MADARFCVGFSSACKQAREGGGLPASVPLRSSRGRFLPAPSCPFLPPDIVRLIDALVRRLEHEDTLLRMNGGELGRTLCEKLARAGGLLDVRFLLARGADVETRTVYVDVDDEYNWSALEWAADAGHLSVCIALLDAGAGERDRALYKASFSAHTPVVALLLDRGADIHFSDGLVLVNAAQEGHPATARLLLDRGADVHARNNAPLILATQLGHLEMVRLLLDRDADIHSEDDLPLRAAAECGQLQTVRLLLDRGADIHALDEHTLRWARQNRHGAVVALLLERGALEPEDL